MSDNDFFAELEAELATFTKATKLREDREAAKRRANNMRASAEVRAKAKAQFLSLDAQLSLQEWQSVATVALFHEQQCSCGSTHYTFLQYMEEQALIRKTTTRRWVKVLTPNPDLERQSLVQPMTTSICAYCAAENGFAISSARRLKSRRDSLTPAKEFT